MIKIKVFKALKLLDLISKKVDTGIREGFCLRHFLLRFFYYRVPYLRQSKAMTKRTRNAATPRKQVFNAISRQVSIEAYYFYSIGVKIGHLTEIIELKSCFCFLEQWPWPDTAKCNLGLRAMLYVILTLTLQTSNAITS